MVSVDKLLMSYSSHRSYVVFFDTVLRLPLLIACICSTTAPVSAVISEPRALVPSLEAYSRRADTVDMQ